MQYIERNKLEALHTQRIRDGVPKQELMKMYNIIAEYIAEGHVEIAVPHQENLVQEKGIFYDGVM